MCVQSGWIYTRISTYLQPTTAPEPSSMKSLILFGLLAVVSAQVTCPDHQSYCPTGTTCCILRSGRYGCCPIPNAVCCSDDVHCCPDHTTCDVAHGRCISAGLGARPLMTKTAAFSLTPAH